MEVALVAFGAFKERLLDLEVTGCAVSTSSVQSIRLTAMDFSVNSAQVIDDLIAVTNMFVEISGKIVGIAILFPCPSVKKLFNYKKSKFIADVNENFCSGVVSNSDRIDTHIFHNGHLAVYGIIVRGRTFQNLCLYIIQLRFFDGP